MSDLPPSPLHAPWLGFRPSFDAFVGRAELLAAVCAHVEGGARLVTLLGAGGMGKTRVAMEAAHALRARFERVVFLDLSTAATQDDIVFTTLRLHGVELEANTDPGPSVLGLLGAGTTLVVADNLEQVIDPAALTLREWLERCPGLQILATSRRALDLDGELRVGIAPLTTDEGVALLEARLEDRSAATFDRAALTAVVGAVEGFPLALEMAAARLDHMLPADVVAQLGSNANVLRSTRRGTAERHQSIAATIGWSWSLLDEPERGLLEAVSLFRSDFGMEAASAVAPPQGWVGDLLQRVVGHSLVRSHEGRYELWISVREFARERLDQRPDRALLIDRATAWGETWAAAAVDQLVEKGSRDAGAAIVREYQNLCALIELATPERAVRLAQLLADAVPTLPVRPQLERLAGALRKTDAAHLAARVSYARLLHAVGRMDDAMAVLGDDVAFGGHRGRYLRASTMIAQGDVGAGIDLLADVAREALAAGEVRLSARTHMRRSSALGMMGDRDGARQDADQAVRLYASIEHPAESVALGVRGDQEPDPDVAIAFYREGAAVAQRHAFDSGRVHNLTKEGFKLVLCARPAEGLVALEAALEDVVRDTTLRQLLQVIRALAVHGTGDLARAQALYEHALTSVSRTISVHEQGWLYGEYALLCWERGHARDALVYFDLSLERFERVGRPPQHAVIRLRRAALLALDIDPEPEISAALEALGGDDPAGRAWSLVAHAVRADWDANRIHEFADALRAGNWGSAARDVAIALRILDSVRSAAAEIVMTRDARWSRIGTGAWVDLGTKRAARLCLQSLATARDRTPGKPLSVSELVEAGWPGERILPEAASNRVYAVVKQLRQLGLGEALLRTSEGYLLDPKVGLHWRDAR